ncbi:MAG: hypothetical protein LWW77_10725 [Propionibacteriales bacterium]|nr:hypothetical protein [Propionibacteriales bacterium]
MAKSFVLVLSAALAGVMVAGCAPADPAGQPTYSCTPEAGGTPFPCYKVQRDEYDKLDALYAEAEAVYRRYLAEDERILRAGGVEEPTPVMLETLSGDALSSAASVYVAFRKTGTRLEGGPVKLAWLKRRPDALRPGMKVAMQSCVDSNAAVLSSPGEADEPAGFTSDTMNFGVVDGVLRIVAVTGDPVPAC